MATKPGIPEQAAVVRIGANLESTVIGEGAHASPGVGGRYIREAR